MCFKKRPQITLLHFLTIAIVAAVHYFCNVRPERCNPHGCFHATWLAGCIEIVVSFFKRNVSAIAIVSPTVTSIVNVNGGVGVDKLVPGAGIAGSQVGESIVAKSLIVRNCASILASGPTSGSRS